MCVDLGFRDAAIAELPFDDPQGVRLHTDTKNSQSIQQILCARLPDIDPHALEIKLHVPSPAMSSPLYLTLFPRNF
jgi:hypothetical protein